MSQNTFDIFDDTAGRHVGQQEKATRRLIESLTERSGGDLDPFATYAPACCPWPRTSTHSATPARRSAAT